MHIVVWRPEMVRRAALSPVLTERDPSGSFARILPVGASRQLGQLIQEVARAKEPTTANAGLAFLLGRAWAQFAASGPLAEQEELHPAVAQAARLLAEDPALSSADLGRRLGVQVDHLRRIFQRDLGVSLVAYRQRQRLEQVVSRWHPQANLTHLALASGFGSYAQFHRVFTAQYGMSPRAWCAQR